MANILSYLFNIADQESPDQLGHYPEKVHVSAMPERRYLWTSRLLVVSSTISLCLNIMLASVVFMLLPERGVRPRLMAPDTRFNQLKLIDPQETTMPATELLVEQLLAEYVFLRHVIINDVDLMRRRWSEDSKLRWYSSQTIWGKFDDYIDDTIERARGQGLNRDVEIMWLTKRAPGLWMAEFRTISYFPDKTAPIVETWHAMMRYVFAQDIRFGSKADHILNPFGFRMETYSISYGGVFDYTETPPEEEQQQQQQQPPPP